ncbi:T9SS type A sorting domain-containing protein [Chitinophagaceae bacterium MMS25-I14]
MKTKKLHIAAGVVAALAFSNQLNAQNTSYNANTTPIGGSGSCAFGVQALNSNTGIANVATGFQCLYSNTAGSYNSGYGYQALYLNTADQNTAFGFRAMKNNTSGTFNMAIGLNALYTNSTGSNNVATGFQALYSNQTASNNTATGYNALYSNTTGGDNTANGYTALYSNTTGTSNVADGSQALYSNKGGGYNVASGWQALYSNVSGNYNVAVGYQAMYVNTGEQNTALGFRALKNNQTGNYNTATGLNALYTSAFGNYNVGDGYQALYTNVSGSNNTAIGYNADVATGALSNATALGNSAVVNTGDKVRIGNTTVSVIEGQVAYTWPSDGRFKENITEDVKGLEFIKLLRPVVYNFNTRKFEEFLTKNMSADQQKAHMAGRDFGPSTAVRQSGFIAQEVEQAAKKTGYDFNGIHTPKDENDNYSLAYAEFVVPLVKGMQEQQKMIEDQKQMIEKLQQQVNDLQKNQGSVAPAGVESNFLAGASMDQNVPNPFSHETVVKFNLPAQVNSAYMAVYDLSGKQLKTISITQRGASSVTITADDLSAGIYIYAIIADGKSISSKRMVVADK